MLRLYTLIVGLFSFITQVSISKGPEIKAAGWKCKSEFLLSPFGDCIHLFIAMDQIGSIDLENYHSIPLDSSSVPLSTDCRLSTNKRKRRQLQ